MQRSAMRHERSAPEGRSVRHPASRSSARVQMSPRLRAAVFACGALLWLSGALWLVLHFAFAEQTPFGPLPNPWEPTVMRVHGACAIAAVFLLGWVGAAHVAEGWARVRYRLSGFVLVGSAALLVSTGYAIYYTTGALHDLSARIHDWVGSLSILIAIAHWRRVRGPR